MAVTNEAGSVSGHRLYHQRGPFSLQQIVAAIGGSTVSANRPLTGLAPLNVARHGDVSLLKNRRYPRALAATTAGTVIVSPEFMDTVPASAAVILCSVPDKAWATVSGLFHPIGEGAPGIDSTASVTSDATVDTIAEIRAFAGIGSGADIGAGCVVEAHAVIGQGGRVGAGCRVGALVSISHAVLRQRVRVLPDTRIGQDGSGSASLRPGLSAHRSRAEWSLVMMSRSAPTRPSTGARSRTPSSEQAPGSTISCRSAGVA